MWEDGREEKEGRIREGGEFRLLERSVSHQISTDSIVSTF
jgi:hypothetical protein